MNVLSKRFLVVVLFFSALSIRGMEDRNTEEMALLPIVRSDYSSTGEGTGLNREVIKPSRKAIGNIGKRNKRTPLSDKSIRRIGLCTAGLLLLASTGGAVLSGYSFAPIMKDLSVSCDTFCCADRIPTKCLPTSNMTYLCDKYCDDGCDPDHPGEYFGGPCEYNSTQEDGFIEVKNCKFDRSPVWRFALSLGGLGLSLFGIIASCLWGADLIKQ